MESSTNVGSIRVQFFDPSGNRVVLHDVGILRFSNADGSLAFEAGPPKASMATPPPSPAFANPVLNSRPSQIRTCDPAIGRASPCSTQAPSNRPLESWPVAGRESASHRWARSLMAEAESGQCVLSPQDAGSQLRDHGDPCQPIQLARLHRKQRPTMG